MMKVWTNNKFEGHWPVGTAAVVVAVDKYEAAMLLSSQLIERGLPEANSEDMQELPVEQGCVRILCDGVY